MTSMQELTQISGASRWIRPVSHNLHLITLTYRCEFEFKTYENWDGVWELEFPYIRNFWFANGEMHYGKKGTLKFTGSSEAVVIQSATSLFIVAKNHEFEIPWLLGSHQEGKPWLDGVQQ
jgi:hypothetical protein